MAEGSAQGPGGETGFRIKKRSEPIGTRRAPATRVAKSAAPTPVAAPVAAPSQTVASRSRGDAVVAADRLTKYYGSLRALSNVSLSIGRGEVFGFLGPNGAGKTTFTKILMGYCRPTAGAMRLFGRDPAGDPVGSHARVGIIPDQFGFYSNLTGRANLDFYARLYGIPASARPARIRELLDVVGMTDRADTRVRTYSHGMRQRLVIAQALLPDPELVIFDEPTTGLDPKGAYEVRELIKRLASEGRTIFLSSHILAEVEEVCTRVGILNKGVVLKVAGVDELRKEFQAGVSTIVVRVAGVTNKVLAALTGVPGVDAVREEEGALRVDTRMPDLAPEVAAAILKAGGRLRHLSEERASLEEMFLALTEGTP